MEISFAVSQKVQHNSTPMSIPRRIENTCLHKKLHTYVDSSIIHNSQNVLTETEINPKVHQPLNA